MNAICNLLCGTDLYACGEGDQEPEPSKFRISTRENSIEGQLYDENVKRDHKYRTMQLQLER